MTTTLVQLEWRRDTAANWISANPTLADGEPGKETDTGKWKLGDGSTPWTALDYQPTTANVTAAAATANAAIPSSEKGVADGVGTLDSTGRQTATEVPLSVVSASTTIGHPTTGTWAVGQAVVDGNGDVWTCTVAGTPGTWVEGASGGGASLDTTATDIKMNGTQAAGSVGKAADAGHVHPSEAGTRFATVLAYGADPTGTTDSTTAFQDAINAVKPTAVGGPSGIVYVPAGNYLVGPITLNTRVHLCGAGIGSTRLIFNSTTANAVLISNSQNENASGLPANMCEVSDMMLDGALQKGTWQSGIVWQNPVAGYEYNDARHRVTRVMVQGFSGDGFVNYGKGDTVFADCVAWVNDGFGFIIGSDCYADNCDAGSSGIDGFYSTGNALFSNCKSWFSGRKLTSSMAFNATALSVAAPGNAWDPTGPYTLAASFGNGFFDKGSAGAIFANCAAQDNARCGFVANFLTCLTGCNADSNNNNGIVGASGTTGLGSYAGFEFNASIFEAVGCISWDRAANQNHQAAAVNINSWDIVGRLHFQFRGKLNDGSHMPPFTAGSPANAPGLDIRVNGGGDSYQLWYASYGTHIDPYVATTFDVTLDQNWTLSTIQYADAEDDNNPAESTTGTFLYPGLRVRLILRQDGTGSRTVTLPANVKVTTPLGTKAGAITIWDLVYDGTNWNQMASGPPIASGTATLAAGSVVVSNANTTANTIVNLSYAAVGGTPGAVFISAKTAGTSFTIKSTSSTDTSQIRWEVVAW